MKLKMNTGLIPGLFDGTYYTQWELNEYDSEGRYEVEAEYNFSDLVQSIAKAYQSEQPQILRDLQQEAPFISNITFPGTTYSPREYNFESDVIDFELTINKAKLLKTVRDLCDPLLGEREQVKRGEAFAKFLEEHYRSRDGFMSFTPDNPAYLWEVIKTGEDDNSSPFSTGPTQAIAAVISFLCRDELRDIQEHVYEYWSGSGYCGLNYTTVEQEAAA